MWQRGLAPGRGRRGDSLRVALILSLATSVGLAGLASAVDQAIAQGESGGADGGSADAQPQPAEEWSDVYECIGPPGLDCPRQAHAFDVTTTHARIVLDVTITAPTVTCCNNLLVGLTTPDGEEVTDGFAFGPHAAGESVRVVVDDPGLLALHGEWNAFLDTPDTGAMVVPYDARVVFQPGQPADVLDPAGDAEAAWLDIERMWIDRGEGGVPRIHLQMLGPVPIPDLGTGGVGGQLTTYRVDFDAVDANGGRLSLVDGEHVRLEIYEANYDAYLCIHVTQEDVCTPGNDATTIDTDTITWDLTRDGGAAGVEAALHFDNISAATTTRVIALGQDAGADRAPDDGVERGLFPPRGPDLSVTGAPGLAAPAGDVPSGGTFAVAATAGIAAIALGGWLLRPLGQARLPRGVLGLALFTRIQRDDALRHERRAALFDAIQAEPGVTFSELRQRLDIGSGSLAHHLRVLQQQGFITHQGDGQRRRFHVRGPAVALDPYVAPARRAVLDAVREHPGATPTSLATLVGMPRRAVQYHLGLLLEQGHIRRRRDGRHARYFV